MKYEDDSSYDFKEAVSILSSNPSCKICMDATFFGMNRFLTIFSYATDTSKISSDQKRLFFAVSLYPLSFFANTPFKM